MKFSNRYAWLLPTLALAGLAACALATGGARPAPKAHLKAKAAPAAVTYAHDIAPILYQNCTTCHRTGEVAPFTLASYGDARKRARQIALVTTQHVMPPWKADSHGEFQDERRLTTPQIALLHQWADEVLRAFADQDDTYRSDYYEPFFNISNGQTRLRPLASYPSSVLRFLCNSVLGIPAGSCTGFGNDSGSSVSTNSATNTKR